MAAPQTSSRLQLLQARFQQKQLQEKEQKLLQLYDQQQQRAHQVAQRGSAGSNGSSNGSSHGSAIANPTGKVRQMFDERRQNNAKGIDKSYPLEPLKKQGGSGPRRAALAKRNSKSELSSGGVGSTGNARATVAANAQRENASREAHAASRTFSKDSSARGESLSRESYASSRGESRQVEATNDGHSNGRTNNGHRYEINIDEVIDNEAMERNRMLAKFHAVEIEKRRRFLDEFPEDLPADESYARKSSLSEARADQRSRNASVKRGNASPPAAQPAAPTRKRAEPEIPRQSTLMKTTKSASLKMRKLPKKKKTLEGKKKSSRKVEETLKQEITKKVAQVENPTSSWSDMLKSTSLIYEVIRSHTKFEETGDLNKLGKVMTIVTKIEESTKENAKAAGKTGLGASATGREDKQKLESANDALNSEGSQQAETLETREEKDQGDGLVSLEGNLTLTIRGNRESSVEKPTDRQEITVADQAWIKVRAARDQRAEQPWPFGSSGDCANRARRASFELKRLMFEQIQSEERFARRDSVESALRHFDSIGLDVTDSSLEPVPITSGGARCAEERKAPPEERAASTGENSPQPAPKSLPPAPTRLCKDLAGGTGPARGFERHTSAWSIRTARGRQATGKLLSRRKVREAARLKKSSSKKLLEARDSIELARVFIGAKSPVCRRKHLDSPTGKSPGGTIVARVNSQSSPSSGGPRNTRAAGGKQIFKNDQSLSSSTRRAGDLNLRKSPPSSRAAESTTKADVAAYPASKSPENNREQKNRAASKSSSLKFLNQIVGSNEAAGTENGFSSVDTQDSDASAFPENKSFEDEKALGTAAPRTASSLSSNSSVGSNRQQGGAGNARQSSVPNRAKSNATPTPAQRSSLPAKNNNTNDESLSTCKICNRRFASERITLHEQICAKTSQKKRKQFDTVTQRVRGTELEPFVAKPVGSKRQTKSNAAPAKPEAPKSNWRRKHEDFINAIRSAKQVQAHLAAGGKLSDLPPPPPSDTSDYIQCPHCSRKFNQTAAERHIPKCETMQHNKPRVQPRSVKR